MELRSIIRKLSLDVHPTNKKIVGERLSLLAQTLTYHQQIEYSGSAFEKYELNLGKIHLFFSNAQGLKTNDNKSPKGFVLYGYNLHRNKEIIIDAENISIAGNKIIIRLPAFIQLTSIRYAWAPYPDCNLINNDKLPASPFKIELSGNF
ncbi:hypothetical protein [Emticicia sp. BO119]|uniref:hypothetical protein n=1 Tax=Emticicia sp. BO119 TaxID=2757768 RepID=UPI0015EFE432|nr:hypothetical protein [Emticicia sp. BO119]MBA4853670.1 hypothetical protein [Emticicia sp. BO119]